MNLRNRFQVFWSSISTQSKSYYETYQPLVKEFLLDTLPYFIGKSIPAVVSLTAFLIGVVYVYYKGNEPIANSEIRFATVIGFLISFVVGYALLRLYNSVVANSGFILALRKDINSNSSKNSELIRAMQSLDNSVTSETNSNRTSAEAGNSLSRDVRKLDDTLSKTTDLLKLLRAKYDAERNK